MGQKATNRRENFFYLRLADALPFKSATKLLAAIATKVSMRKQSRYFAQLIYSIVNEARARQRFELQVTLSRRVTLKRASIHSDDVSLHP